MCIRVWSGNSTVCMTKALGTWVVIVWKISMTFFAGSFVHFCLSHASFPLVSLHPLISKVSDDREKIVGVCVRKRESEKGKAVDWILLMFIPPLCVELEDGHRTTIKNSCSRFISLIFSNCPVNTVIKLMHPLLCDGHLHFAQSPWFSVNAQHSKQNALIASPLCQKH